MTALPSCPIAAAVALVGDKWKIQILRELLRNGGTDRRFGQLKAGIEHISDKMLSQSLKALEADHLVCRRVLDVKPVGTAYSLTEMGKQLGALLWALYDWGRLYQQTYPR